jgi:hypothetical protein
MDANVFSREPNGLVALRMTQDEWDELLMVLGYKIGLASKDSDKQMFDLGLRVVNRLNTGNPDFIPYAIDDDRHVVA